MTKKMALIKSKDTAKGCRLLYIYSRCFAFAVFAKVHSKRQMANKMSTPADDSLSERMRDAAVLFSKSALSSIEYISMV
jgi:hypothetical protein